MTLLPDYLKSLKELEAKASPTTWLKEDYRDEGAWRSSGLIWSCEDLESWTPGNRVCRIHEKDLDELNIETFEADGDLICGLRNALPRIIQDMESLLKENKKMREALDKAQHKIICINGGRHKNNKLCDYCIAAKAVKESLAGLKEREQPDAKD